MAQVPIPNCNDPEDPCVVASPISAARALVAIDDQSGCPHPLSGIGIAVHDGESVRMCSGSKGEPIKFPDLHTLAEGMPLMGLLGILPDGALVALMANGSPGTKVITGANGEFREADPVGASCFPESEICEDCEVAYEAVWTRKKRKDGSYVLCLARRPVRDQIYVEDTNSMEHTGEGSFESPLRFNAKLSSDAGNIMTIEEDGLRAGCCYGTDPIAESLT